MCPRGRLRPPPRRLVIGILLTRAVPVDNGDPEQRDSHHFDRREVAGAPAGAGRWME
jgi:hypothetical protein